MDAGLDADPPEQCVVQVKDMMSVHLALPQDPHNCFVCPVRKGTLLGLGNVAMSHPRLVLCVIPLGPYVSV